MRVLRAPYEEIREAPLARRSDNQTTLTLLHCLLDRLRDRQVIALCALLDYVDGETGPGGGRGRLGAFESKVEEREDGRCDVGALRISRK